jgi:hydroxymethylglutaryl-CoA reductase
MISSSRLTGFRNLEIDARHELLAQTTGLESTALDVLRPEQGLTLEQAAQMIENAIGVLGIPLGIALNFTINGRDFLVPMATEEPSVIAAASNAARIARVHGGFFTSSTEPIMQAQVQVVDVADPSAARLRLLEARAELIELANVQDPMLTRLGGGMRELSVRLVETPSSTYVVAHLIVDVRDAMGANAVNTMAEAVADRIAAIARGRVLLRILTNKADQRLARARAVFDAETLGGPQVVQDILHAYVLAAADPYRAATHNKGIMNGITAVVLATGNDTRAVEAGAHSHAISPGGHYTSLSHFERDADGNLVGSMELPMPVGLVGGATKVHPAAQAAVKLLGVSSARELAELLVAVGLAQNLAAMRALATEGIQRGHMALHARNVAVAAGATADELEHVVSRMINERAVRSDAAERMLAELRPATPPAGGETIGSSKSDPLANDYGYSA